MVLQILLSAIRGGRRSSVTINIKNHTEVATRGREGSKIDKFCITWYWIIPNNHQRIVVYAKKISVVISTARVTLLSNEACIFCNFVEDHYQIRNHVGMCSPLFYNFWKWWCNDSLCNSNSCVMRKRCLISIMQLISVA